MKKWLLGAVAIIFILAGCGNEEESNTSSKELKKISVVLDWTPNTNHTGLYVAKDRGYFKDEGLDVEIILPGEAGADQLVASGKADFGISYQESITRARVEDVPLVSIAAIIQHNTSGFASPSGKEILSPKDFEGKTYGGWGDPVEKAVMESVMKSENSEVDKVEFVNMGSSDFFTAVKRDIDFAWIYYGWTGIEAELRGEELNMVYLTDYSNKLDYYTPVLATNESKIEDDPEVVKAFLAAVSKGYRDSIENPDEAAEVLLTAVPDLDEELVKKSQSWLADKYQADAPRWGEQKTEIWENYANWMFENGLMEQKLEANEAFTTQFLPK
ncbi:ABC transporter substrate-binding protein [Bacillus sp. 2205SS5-2]|uniref:ABC transporter substrate-binding protein n=1 Tax=Bacillus sp. 2205SS5-2 TaxID=3109031 RepID=UPI0030069B47